MDTVWRNKDEAVETNGTSYAGNAIMCLIPVGTLSLYITGKRSLNNAAETYGRQLENGKILLEQFWDNSNMSRCPRLESRLIWAFSSSDAVGRHGPDRPKKQCRH